MNINRIIITGNLVANPTLRNTDSGTPVASAIANNEFYNDGRGRAAVAAGLQTKRLTFWSSRQFDSRRRLSH
jgi:single-stranded DNA-binding protein